MNFATVVCTIHKMFPHKTFDIMYFHVNRGRYIRYLDDIVPMLHCID